MKIQLGSGKDKKDNSLALFHGEAASSSMENAGCAYQAPSVLAAGASAQGVAFLTCLTNLILAMLLLKVPGLVEGKASSLKRTTLIIAIVNTCSWLPLVFAILFLNRISPFLIIALWIINLVPTTLVYPLRDNWLASLIPSDKMGRYLSLRSITSGLTYLVTFYLMGFVLDKVTGDVIYSYAYILAFAFLAAAISNVFYFGIRPPAMLAVSDKKQNYSFLSFLKDNKRSTLGTFILFVSMYTFSVSLISPLFAAYMLSELKFSYLAFTAIMSCEYITRILSLTVWGRQVDKVGSLRVLNAVAYFIPLVPIFWLFSTNFIYLMGIQIISGTVWAAFDLSVQTFVYKATPPDQRLRYIVYYRSLTTASVAIGAVCGGLLLNHMFSIFGSQILGLFLVSGILRMAVAKIMLPKLTLQTTPETVINPGLAPDMVTVPAVAKMGLYYYPDKWRGFTNQSKTVKRNAISRTSGSGNQSHNGLFYNPADWTEYGNKFKPKPAMTELRDYNRSVGEGLYYNRTNRSLYQPQKVKQDTLKLKNQNTTHDGLFYNQNLRNDYLKQWRVLNTTTIGIINDSPVTRQPVFYHPETWSKYSTQSLPEKKRMILPRTIDVNTAITRIPQYKRLPLQARQTNANALPTKSTYSPDVRPSLSYRQVQPLKVRV